MAQKVQRLAGGPSWARANSWDDWGTPCYHKAHTLQMSRVSTLALSTAACVSFVEHSFMMFFAEPLMMFVCSTAGGLFGHWMRL